MIIQLPAGDYNRKQFAKFCERFGCKLLASKKGEKHLFVISSEDPINFFWLGANINFRYESGFAVSAASAIFHKKEQNTLKEDFKNYNPPKHKGSYL